jgi:hypothetical protein
MYNFQSEILKKRKIRETCKVVQAISYLTPAVGKGKQNGTCRGSAAPPDIVPSI